MLNVILHVTEYVSYHEIELFCQCSIAIIYKTNCILNCKHPAGFMYMFILLHLLLLQVSSRVHLHIHFVTSNNYRYPAGFIYIFIPLYHLTNAGNNVRLAQYVFAALYLINIMLVFGIYQKVKKVVYCFF